MKLLNQTELQFWKKYINSQNEKPKNPYVHAAMAGNSEIADQLLALYLSGKKTAGSSLVKDYNTAGVALPVAGNFWIILDSHKNPRCIVKSVKVETYRFNQVPVEVAIAEGEGDLTLDYWRAAHIDFFTPYLKDWGVTDIDSEELITEFFEVVYK